MKLLQVINNSFYSNKKLSEAKDISFLSALLIFALSVLLLGLGSAYVINNEVENTLFDVQPQVKQQMYEAVQAIDGCAIEDKQFSCRANSNIMLSDSILIFSEENIDASTNNVIGFFDNGYMLQYGELFFLSPYLFDYNSQTDDIAAADVAEILIFNLLETSNVNILKDEIVFSLMIYVVGVILIVSVIFNKNSKMTGKRGKRMQWYKMGMIVLLAPSVYAVVISVLINTNVVAAVFIGMAFARTIIIMKSLSF